MIHKFIDKFKYFTTILVLCFSLPPLPFKVSACQYFSLDNPSPPKRQQCQHFGLDPLSPKTRWHNTWTLPKIYTDLFLWPTGKIGKYIMPILLVHLTKSRKIWYFCFWFKGRMECFVYYASVHLSISKSNISQIIQVFMANIPRILPCRRNEAEGIRELLKPWHWICKFVLHPTLGSVWQLHTIADEHEKKSRMHFDESKKCLYNWLERKQTEKWGADRVIMQNKIRK